MLHEQSIDELLDNVGYKTSSGILDFTNVKHLCILESELKKTKRYSDEFIKKLIEDIRKNAYLLLEKESNAAAMAHKKGLEHAGYGYWSDKSGNVVAKSEGDKLIPILPKDAERVKKNITSKNADNNRMSKKDVKKSLAPEPKKEKPKLTAFSKTSPDIKDFGMIIAATKTLTKELSGVKFESEDDKKIVAGFLGRLKEGDFEPLQKYPKIINKYIRVGGNLNDAKLYIATKEPNNFSQGMRHKVERIGKEFQSLLLQFGMKTAITTTTSGKESLVVSKSLSGGKLFSGSDEVENANITSTETSLTVSGHTIYKLKEPKFGELVDIYRQRGSENPQRDAQFAMRAIRKHNTLLKELSEKLTNSVKFISPVPGVSPNTEEGRKTISDATINKISTTIRELFKKSPSKELTSIVTQLNALTNSSDFEKDSLTVLTQMANSQELAKSAADVAELFTYVRRLKSGQIAYLPAQSNFPLADIISMSPLKLTDKSSTTDIVDAMQSVFVSFDYRSIKKGEGGAATIFPKINLSVFKSKDTRKDLTALASTFDEIWDNKKINESFKIAKPLAKKYGININEIMNNSATKNTIGTIVTRLDMSGFIKPDVLKKQLVVHNMIGKMIESIYNTDVDLQLFSNERYKESKSQMSLSITDGIHSISLLNFVLDIGKFNIKSGKPETKYATRFYKKELE